MLRTIAVGLLLAAATVAPLDALRAGPIGSLADLGLALAAALLAVTLVNGSGTLRVKPYVRVLASAVLVIIGGLVGTLFAVELTASSLANVARFGASVAGLPLIMAALQPSRAECRSLAWAFVLGCIINGIGTAAEVNPATLRSSGLALHPNALGLSSAFAVCLVLGLRVESMRHRWLTWPLLGVLLFGLSNSGSRAAFLALVVGVTMTLATLRRFKLLLGGAIAAIVLGSLLATGLYQPPHQSALGRLLYEQPSTVQSDLGRAQLHAEVVERIDQRYVTGSGFGQATQAHNVYLQVIDSAGLIGLLGFAALLASVLRRILRFAADPLAAAGAGLLIGYSASAPFSNAMWDRWIWIPVVVALAATTRSTTGRRTRQSPAAPGLHQVAIP